MAFLHFSDIGGRTHQLQEMLGEEIPDDDDDENISPNGNNSSSQSSNKRKAILPYQSFEKVRL